jgi:hypothetical protein
VTATGERTTPSRDGGRRVRSASRVARPPRASRGRLTTASALLVSGYYATLAVVSTLLAMASLGMFSRPLAVPLVYSGDAISGGAQIKGTLENGWYEHNPALGAPFGQNLHDFPTADNLQFALARVIGVVVDDWASVYNLCFLVSFPLTAMAAAWFIRTVGGGRVAAFVFGLLYAFTPYHFIHGQPHLALSMLFVVPLFSAVILRALGDGPVWGRRETGRWANPLTWATPKTLGVLAILALTGSTSSYYAVFGLILMSVAVLVLLLRRRWRRTGGAVVAMLGLIFFMLLNMAPDILYARSVPASPAAFARQPLESEVYALKLASLVFPVPWHRIHSFSEFRLHYDSTFANPGESATLGVVAALGFVFLMALPLVVTLMRRPVADDGPFGRTQQHLSLLTFVAFLFGTTGALGTLFAIFLSSEIRAWNRIVVYLALFALAAMALHFDTGRRWLVARVSARWAGRGSTATLGRRAGALTAVCAVTVAAVGLWDEAAPPSWTSNTGAEVGEWNEDAAYVDAIEAEVPKGTAIFEMPAMQFPESPPIWDMHDYDPLRPYLHSTDLSWSYGGLKGRPRSDWQLAVSGLPTLRQLVALAASGFGGIHLDRFGFPGHDPGELEDDLRALFGDPITGADGRFEFFDMTAFAASLKDDYSQNELDSIRRHTVRQPTFYWQPGFGGPQVPDATGHLVLAGKSAAPSAVIDNPGGPIEMKLTFTIQAVGAAGYPADVRVTWPDGEEQAVRLADSGGTEVTHTFTAEHGQQTLSLRGDGMTAVNLIDLVLRDPGLYFDLRGTAGDLAAEQAAQRDDERP